VIANLAVIDVRCFHVLSGGKVGLPKLFTKAGLLSLFPTASMWKTSINASLGGSLINLL
jgi:hypothetical protein